MNCALVDWTGTGTITPFVVKHCDRVPTHSLGTTSHLVPSQMVSWKAYLSYSPSYHHPSNELWSITNLDLIYLSRPLTVLSKLHGRNLASERRPACDV